MPVQDLGISLDAGDIVGERFRLIRRLGKGGMGTVWRARHLTLESDVAVKLVDPAIARTTEGRARFKREAQSAAAIRSPHVVQILDHGVHEQIPFIVMELLEGESLAQRLDRGPLSLAETVRVLVQVGRAITRAHEAGVVHRDLKPDNVFLVKNDDEEIAKVLDFGIAKARFQHTEEDTTRTGAILGTPHYMSPEQLRGDKALDHRADVWALGVIAYECVTQKKPFISETFPDLVIKICSEDPPPPSRLVESSPGFDAWFFKSTARDPALRFDSVREQVRALRALTEPDSDSAPSGPDTPPPKQDSVPFSETVAAVSEVAFNTQHATANTRPMEPVRARSRAWLIALGVLLLGAGGVAIARFGTTLTSEPVASELGASGSSAASASASKAPALATPSSELGSVAPGGESEPAPEPDGGSGEPRRASPPHPQPPSAKTAASPPTSARARTTAERPTSKPAASSAPKATSAKPATTGTPQVDLGI